ncbi:helix-turn-helix domain-containing protein [Paraferrimonas haliotis]|uniref:IS481 family transposase n=1 Tax=Paraferrimonas haliotis TaxID=2013866 RepID=A0AA37TM93_9GAMM|nr:helix-turn-helix domain-containing protein [Paraferrimonas haliotis]GLS82065.1 IS481 family transposase [Paraferrimonas haliotis]
MNSKRNKADIRNKLALLQLAEELNSISKACDIMGYSRDSYYRFKKQYEAAGELGLHNLSRTKPAIKNRVDRKLEEQVIEIALDYPDYGQAKAADVLTARGNTISPSGVRSIWKRHNLETKKLRLFAQQVAAAQQLSQSKSSDESDIFLKDSLELGCRYPGDICIQDTFSLGSIDGLGALYQHTFLDGYSQFAVATISLFKDAPTAAYFLSHQVIHQLNQQELTINQLLTDKGKEFFGSASQSFQSTVAHLNIKHFHKRAYNGPVVNGLAARFHKLMWDEFYEPSLKSKRYLHISELESDMQAWLARYNRQFAIAGRYTLGKTPLETIELTRHLRNHFQ